MPASTGAAGSARDAPEALAGADSASGIFGDFAEAQQFHRAVSGVHQQHRDQLGAHHKTLNGVWAQAVNAAQVLTGADESVADAVGVLPKSGHG
ncbi:DUF2563 family protein [Candidatus Mycobacterium methanotrophicum]|uniref:DUF2563 family protein n=1 Tax=Candidatus Mycobacterium methanotrophicum TaxID=2943498 RepID=A0ABY4QQW8_9MYCO|nr:DUF2563 family protein [Candidatus Mycobacterium methanotrophicum]UQX12872.1 DUF2563 family protein [Candidatus Mycobacterium methanotrophicum]